MRMIFFDTETTGIRPGNICQLSYILVDTDYKPTKTIGKNIFFTVDYVEPSAEDVHGFSVDALFALSDGKTFEDSYEGFIEDFISADILIGHNVNFDIKFLTHELENCGHTLNPKHTFCTMKYYKDICKLFTSRGGYKNPKLAEAIKFLDLNEDQINLKSNKYFGDAANFHDARFDTTATYLLVTEGIKKGFIPKHYFTNLAK
ncbi:3'-5' exonuclease [Clostridium estertheticum]|uniref:3'-5' exonuclease n=1 Tax=Clostridium estertheticum TaxID=238834 RepID=A0AA47I4G8_9CLOT|nr:3'-5' exonuclease [Clostridium estertheticum]MBU3156159.1 3'-5' exonuclease [Clostridium estertheticum]MBU3199390.1 3'-5' exonuclease [Clostridium estertheticum]WAG58598.1 3'-5' exonuclease [Clostridium estertheticum]WAG67366.1 3'-5' exonuclease [Clostridium estertheticum]